MRSYFVFLILLTTHNTIAQNQVSNSGFESVLPCPTTVDQIVTASPWNDLSGATFNSDAYHVCNSGFSSPNCSSNAIPHHAAGYSFARSGDGFAGLIAYQSGNTREYISAPLIAPLLPGNVYEVSFWIKKSRYSRYACNNIGALLSNGALIQSGSNALGIIPSAYSAQVISDSVNWQFVSNMYVASGGEDHITIGNFNDDISTTVIDMGFLGSSCNFVNNSAYYYIDDVSVIPFVETIGWSGDTILCRGQNTTIQAFSNVPVWWSSITNPGDTISSNNSLLVSPTNSTSYIIHGLFTQHVFTITVLDTPTVNLGPDTSFCNDQVYILDAQNNGSATIWNTGETQSSITPVMSGIYWVDVDNGGCEIRDSVEITIHPLPTSLLNSYYIMCSDDNIFPMLDPGPAAAYKWSPTGDTIQEIEATMSGTYTVELISIEGCATVDSTFVLERCEPRIFVPTAFTPDGDGLNDVFKPTVSNLTSYTIYVYNRWGQSIFTTEFIEEGWDGTFKNSEVPQGVYFYRIDYKSLQADGTEIEDKIGGHFVLYR